MFPRYRLNVFFKSSLVFTGDFESINRMVKVATMFDDECRLESFDNVYSKYVPLDDLVAEFVSSVTCL